MKSDNNTPKAKRFYGFNNNIYRSIYGDLLSKQPYGYCRCDAHKGYLSKNLIKKHKCNKKKCPFLVKNKEHLDKVSENRKLYNKYPDSNIRKLWLNGEITKKEYDLLKYSS